MTCFGTRQKEDSFVSLTYSDLISCLPFPGLANLGRVLRVPDAVGISEEQADGQHRRPGQVRTSQPLSRVRSTAELSTAGWAYARVC